ncbi:MAG: BatD family protein [Planctomycetota bacterium]|nr:BatD family protein [Planctomycetota bacterium]
MKLSVLWLLALAFMAPAHAQNQVSAKARLTTGLANLGETIQLRIIVENAQSARVLKLPVIDDVQVGQLGPANRSSFTEYRGGVLVSRSSLQWSVSLQPTREGEFDIPPVVVEVDGKPQNVEVTPSSLKVVKDQQGGKLGFLEVLEIPKRVYEGQPFPVRLRLGWAERLQVTQASLALPWWGSHSGVLEVEGPGFSQRGKKIQELRVNNRLVVAFTLEPSIEIEGESYRVYENRRTLVATRSTDLEFGQSALKFAEAVEGSGGFGRRPRVREYYATADPFEVEVLPIPEEGRPFEWGGAVGSLKAERRLNARDVVAGETIQLEVTWSGMANIEFFDVPDLKRLDAFEGFRILGQDDTHLGMERRVVYEIVPLTSEVTEVPAVPLWIFNPESEAYELLETEPVPLRVAEGQALDLGDAFGEEEQGEKIDLRDLHDWRSEEPVSAGWDSKWIFSNLLFVLIAWWLLRSQVRKHGDPDSRVRRNLRRAEKTLRRELDAAGDARQSSVALCHFLSVQTGEDSEAWIGRDAMKWARAKDSETLVAAASELKEVLGALDGAAYHSGAAPDRSTILKAAQKFAKQVAA